MSALFDRENPPRHHPRDADDDTAEIPVPTTIGPDDPRAGSLPPATDEHDRMRTTTRTRRLQAALLLGAYAPAILGSAWLTVLAFLRLNSIVMVVMTFTAMWLGRDAVRLARWLLGHLDHGAQAPRLSRLQLVVASVLAALYAYLLIDWLLHQ